MYSIHNVKYLQALKTNRSRIIFLVITALPNTVINEGKLNNFHSSAVSILLGLLDIARLKIAEVTHLNTDSSSSAESGLLRSTFFCGKLEYLELFAFQSDSATCWNADIGSFSVAIDYRSRTDVAICCNITEKYIRSMPYG